MPWLCSFCNIQRDFVLAAKVADIHRVLVGDICLICLREKAEEDIAMEKLDAVGIGYTQAALEEGALQLMLCPKCNKYRSVLLIPKSSDGVCPGCLEVLLHRDARR